MHADTPRSIVTPLVFLDTTVLKFSAEGLVQKVVHPQLVDWGGRQAQVMLTQFVDYFPNDRLSPKFAKEVQQLPFIAHLARRGRIRVITHREVMIEFFGLPKTDDPRGFFCGAPIEDAPDPFPYDRLVAGGGCSTADHQYNFVRSIRHPRYDQLKRAAGAQPGSGKYKNQLLDAFHLLCAESAKADYFLAADRVLIRHVASHRSTKVAVALMEPTVIVKEFVRTGVARVSDILSFARHVWREHRSPQRRSRMSLESIDV